MKILRTWVAMVTVAAALGATSAAQAQAELPTLRFGTYAATLSNMPAFVADKKGLCVKHGFTLEKQPQVQPVQAAAATGATWKPRAAARRLRAAMLR